MKYILVTGGVISGVGKGVISSSFGTLLKGCGVVVTSIKIDPYINIDAGTFSPYEHGETYVLDDGGEVDLDLGNYERFLDCTLHRDNNITTGKVYNEVITKERRGDYLGKTVQVVPHITDCIQDWVEKVAKQPVGEGGEEPQVCIIELGGTIGDIEGMPFVEAFRQFQFRVKRENFLCAHVSLVPQPRSTGEPKTKPTQASVRELRGLGLNPDMIMCRSEKPLDKPVRDKISNFCHVPPEQVICIHDLPSIYHVPLLMDAQGLVPFVNERLHLNLPAIEPTQFLRKWKLLVQRVLTCHNTVSIAIVGKYTQLEDAYASLLKSLEHAALSEGYKFKPVFIEAASLEPEEKISDPVKYHQAWQKLCGSAAVIVPGGFGGRGFAGKVAACTWCREMKKPFLGICLGFQAAVIEFARNVLKLEGANSREIDANTPHPVVIDMPEHNTGQLGGTMRLGRRRTNFSTDKSILRELYNADYVEERHRHRYEVNTYYVPEFEKAGLRFVGKDSTEKRMEILELDEHPYYVAVQYHPEFLSRPLKPSAPFKGLILAAIGRLSAVLSDLQASRQVSPAQLSDEESSLVIVNGMVNGIA